MESGTAVPASPAATGSATIADLAGLAAERFGERVAVRHKVAGEWHDVTFAEVGAIVSEIGRGLIDLGIEPGDRVALLSHTRPEWTYADFAITSAGAVVVPVYATNSPEECAWVAGNSEARAIVCEDAAQVAKIAAVRDRLPQLQAVIVIDPGEPAGHDVRLAPGADGTGRNGEMEPSLPLADLRARGRVRDPAELEARMRAVTREDPYTIIYTSGTTGPPKGCVLTHGNYRDVVSMCEQRNALEPGELVYLFLPLAHSFALLIQLATFDLGSTIAYFGGDPKQIVPELSEVRPTHLPSVPRLFEKLHTLVTAHGDAAQLAQATRLGLTVRAMQAAGTAVPEDLQAHFDAAEERLYRNVRAAFGGNLRQAVTGAAPIAKEILEFFHACGVPVMEGYGLTETATVSSVSTLQAYRIGAVGRPLPGVEVRIADDGEILLKGPNVFAGYFRDEEATAAVLADGWLHTGDLGRMDEDGFLHVCGRKKDIIITSGGKNLTPANVEGELKRSRWISQAVMHGDRRPYPVALITLDPDEIVQFAGEHGLPEDVAALSREPRIHALVQGIVDEVNARYAQPEQIKRFAILDHDLSQETGELTPTLKVKRNVVEQRYAALLDGLYD